MSQKTINGTFFQKISSSVSKNNDHTRHQQENIESRIKMFPVVRSKALARKQRDKKKKKKEKKSNCKTFCVRRKRSKAIDNFSFKHYNRSAVFLALIIS